MKKVAICFDGAGNTAPSIREAMSLVLFDIENNDIYEKNFVNLYGVSLKTKMQHIQDLMIDALIVYNITNEELLMMKTGRTEIFTHVLGSSSDEIIARYLRKNLIVDFKEEEEIENEFRPEDAVVPFLSPLSNQYPMGLAYEIAKDQLDEAGNQQLGYDEDLEKGI